MRTDRIVLGTGIAVVGLLYVVIGPGVDPDFAGGYYVFGGFSIIAGIGFLLSKP